MRLSIKSLVLPASLALFAGGTIAQAGPIVLYTSQGFETTGDFSTTGRAGDPHEMDPADLYGQGNPYWAPDTLPPSYYPYTGHGVPADVETSVKESGLQAVELNRATSSTDTRWAPSTFFAHPYSPVADNTPVIDIDWDMDVASGGSNDLFGIELNDNTSRIAFVAVDQSGKVDTDHAGSVTYTGTSVPADVWEHYDLRANFTTDTYQVFLNGSMTPLEPSVSFEDPASAFTDASLVSYSGDGGPGSGIAYYDNYVVSAPEPTAGGAILAGSGLLLLRRRRVGSAV